MNDAAINIALGFIDKVTAPFKRTMMGLQTSTSRMEKNISSLTRKFSGLTTVIGGAGIVLGLKKAVDSFDDFESALTDMAKVTDRDLNLIKADIMGLPKELGTATELVRGYYQTISAGVTDPQKALEVLTGAAKAAKAAHADQGEVIKVVTKLMAGFQGEIKNVTEATDLLFRIEKQGQTTFQELVPVMGDLATISHEVGVSTDEMGAALALIAQTAGDTSEAATQYKSILVGLFKPQEELTKAFEKLGYESGKAMIKELGLADTLRKLRQYSDETGVSFGKLLGRKEGLIGAAALAANNFEKFNEQLEGMRDRAGGTARAFANWSDTFEAVRAIFKSTLEDILIKLGEKLVPAVTRAMEGLGKWIQFNGDKVIKFFEDTVNAGSKLGSVAASIGKLLQNTLEGWNKLPRIIRDIGIIPAVLGGKVGLGIAMGISLIAKALSDTSDALEKYAQTYEKSLGTLSEHPGLYYPDTAPNERSFQYINDLTEDFKEINAEIENYIEGLAKVTTGTNKLTDATKKQKKAQELSDEELKRRATVMSALDKYVRDFIKWEKELSDQMADQSKTLENLTLDWLDLQKTLERDIDLSNFKGVEKEVQQIIYRFDDLIEKYEDIDGATEYLENMRDRLITFTRANEDAADRSSQAWDNFGQNIQSTLHGVFRRLMDDANSLGEFLVDLAKDIVANVAAIITTQRLVLPITMAVLPAGTVSGIGGGTGMGGGNFFGLSPNSR